MNIIIIHGAFGHPGENWIPWLKNRLEAVRHNVYVPKFPTPDGQNLNNWFEVFKNYEKYLDSDSALIGHSIGAVFVLQILNKFGPVKAGFIVSGFAKLLGNPEFDPINKTFVESFDWGKIKENCENFFVYHGDDDPYVPVQMGKEIADNLGARFRIIEHGGHLNEKAGFVKFKQLLVDIQGVL